MTQEKSKRLLITCDDFGMCHAVNTGIVKAMTNGVVRSTNLMAPCPWFAEAAAMALQHDLPCGVHFTLTCEWDRLRWPSLTGGKTLRSGDGGLPMRVADLASASDDEILAELHAQVARVRSAGIEPTHADSHMTSPSDGSSVGRRLAPLMRQVATAHGLPLLRDVDAADDDIYFHRQREVSSISKDEVWSILERWTSPGSYHLFGHAGEATEELESVCSPTFPARQWAATIRSADLAFFIDPATRSRIADLGFELVDVKQILAAHEKALP